MTDAWSKNQEAVKLTRMAELGMPEQLKAVHQQLTNDMHSKGMTPEKYANLLSDMQDCNFADRKQNANLPLLDLFDSTNRGVPDSVDAHYDSDARAEVSGGAALIRKAAGN